MVKISWAIRLCSRTHIVCIDRSPNCSLALKSPARKHGMGLSFKSRSQSIGVSLLNGSKCFPEESTKRPTFIRPRLSVKSLKLLASSFVLPYTFEASIYEVIWLICSLGIILLKNPDVTPLPQTALDRVNSMHLVLLILGSSSGTFIGKHGGWLSQVSLHSNPSLNWALLKLVTVKSISWSRNWPHCISICEKCAWGDVVSVDITSTESFRALGLRCPLYVCDLFQPTGVLNPFS